MINPGEIFYPGNKKTELWVIVSKFEPYLYLKRISDFKNRFITNTIFKLYLSKKKWTSHQRGFQYCLNCCDIKIEKEMIKLLPFCNECATSVRFQRILARKHGVFYSEILVGKVYNRIIFDKKLERS
jgi:hypothetical protein